MRLFDSSGDSVVRLAQLWSRSITAVAGVKIAVEVRARLDPRRSYVFMANHLSSLDIWALYVALPLPVRMIAKKQLMAVAYDGFWRSMDTFKDKMQLDDLLTRGRGPWQVWQRG